MPVALVGTLKGGFLVRSDDDRAEWQVEGPLFKGWKVTAATRDARGTYFLATASDVYGAAIHASEDAKTWRQLASGPAYSKDSGRKLNQIWTLVPAGSVLYAGVDEAGLFRSSDRGETWEPVTGLNEHPTRAGWFPGFGGLCAHSVLVDPTNPRRLWCGMSAVGVFRSDDGGASWQSKNAGVPCLIEDKVHKDIGFCVHALAHHPGEPDTIYRQDHTGMFRTRDGGDSWQRIEAGLASRFGFPLVIDRGSKAFYAFPLESDEYRMPPGGRFRVFRSRNGGDAWSRSERGLPDNAFAGVLRGAMAVDRCDPCGVYVGSTAGTVHVSRDGGDTWRTIACTLPRILSVAVLA